MGREKTSLELLERMERLKDAAYRDSLTGLLNRGAAEIYIEHALAGMQEDECCMLIIVDLDNFKMVNDTLGHQTGDRVICTAADILSGLFRPGDVVARLGGDEYIIFLCGNITKKLARVKGKSICKNLQLTVGTVRQVSVSSSVGIFFSSRPCASFQEMYRVADRALYRAKNSGKNMFFIDEGDGIASGEADQEEFQTSSIVNAAKEVKHSSNSVAIINNAKDAEIIYADPVFVDMVGLEEYEMEGQILTEYMHPDDISVFHTVAENLADYKNVPVQIRLKNSYGDWIYNKVNAVAIENDESKCILLNFSNVLETAQTSSVQKKNRWSFVDHVDQNRWEVDLAAKKFRFFNSNERFMPIEGNICNFPYDLISSGWIAPESAGRFEKFATDIFTGRIRGYGNFLVKSGDGSDYTWATLSYRAQGDAGGVPRQVVGTVIPLESGNYAENIPFTQKNKIPVPVIDGLIVKMDANVTSDTISKIWVEGKFREKEYSRKNISYFLVNEIRKIYNRGDKVEIINFFSRKNLLSLHEKGVYWVFMEYRRIDSNGYIEWVTLAMNLYRKTMDDEVRIRLSINNSDDRHIWESHSAQKGIRNRETNLYTTSSVKEMMQGLREEASNEFCVAVLLKVEGLEKLFREKTDRLEASRNYIISMLSYTLGTHCVVSRVDEEHYLFLFPDAYSERYLNRTLEMAFNYSKVLLSEVMPVNTIHFSAASACTALEDAEYDRLVSMCRDGMAKMRPGNEDKIILRREKMKNEGDGTDLKNDFEKQITILEPSGQTLDTAGQQVFADCLSDMLLASSPENGLQVLFQRLGHYYQADRIYMISLENSTRDIEVFCEWRLPHLETISISLSRTSMGKLQLLTRCSIEKKPMHYYAKGFGKAEEDGKESEWRYCIFPVCFSEYAYTVTDFLCVENPKEEGDSYALINRLIPYIKNQKLKTALHAEQADAAGSNRLENMANLLDYIHIIPEILSHKHKSTAVYLAKVPRISILNSQHGFAYGYNMMLYIVDVLTRTAGEQYLFRTWDNEFIVVLPDLERAAAEEKYKRLKMTFEKKYGDHVFVSYRWTEGNFSSRDLMDMPKTGIRGSIIDVEKYLKNQTCMPSEADAHMEECGFTVYLQPVFHVKTAELAGAELLVRGVDKNGEIIQPRRFLKQMEHDHTIKNLDLFVLEQALCILDKWREAGVKEIPLSINFSKDTILNPTIIASFLAVRSRYPQLGECKIGIEIPQNIGRENYSRLSSVMEQLREFGAEFAVDDIGVDRDNAKIVEKLRFERVKIDHSLMVDVGVSEPTRDMIRTIVNSCLVNKTDCVAEGIETQKQLEIVRMLGCEYAQGFYYDRPITVEEFNYRYMNRKGNTVHE